MAKFGTNPGALIARTYIPKGLPHGAPLVVVLHGCTQNAAVYDRGSGWSELADRHRFALLFPEQTRSNNANVCFNWYQHDDARRGRGEAASIAQMVRTLTRDHGTDSTRVFINGLSAGGAMTAVMLACYPELFAGGAIIAGLAFGIADNVPEALERMRGQGMPSRRALASRMVNAADHNGDWPTLSVWHGTADHTVNIANAALIVDQWRDRVGLGETPGEVDRVDGQQRTSWRDKSGRVMVERYDIEGMGHGTPLDDDACGQAGPHMLAVGICSTRRIAQSWGLTKGRASVAAAVNTTEPALTTTAPRQSGGPALRKRHAHARPTGVAAVIEEALRAAGLMR